MSHTRQLRLKVNPKLAQTAIKQGLDIPCRLWFVMRAIDRQGSGRVMVGELCDVWPQTERTIRTALKRGEGLFWEVIGKQGQHRSKQAIELHSLERVCLALGTIPNDRPVWLSIDKAVSIQGFRAHCYAAWCTKERTIGRATLCELWDTTKPTLRAWEKAAPIKRKKNVGSATPKHPDDWEHIPSGQGVWRVGDTVFWQLPNTYVCESLEKAARAKRTASRVRYALFTEVEAATYTRLYWKDAEAAFKAANKGKTGPYFYTSTDELFAVDKHVWLQNLA